MAQKEIIFPGAFSSQFDKARIWTQVVVFKADVPSKLSDVQNLWNEEELLMGKGEVHMSNNCSDTIRV